MFMCGFVSKTKEKEITDKINIHAKASELARKLQELKKQRRELDAKIKEIEDPKYLRCGSARYEHRVYATGKVEEIIAVCRPRNIRGTKYSEWWGQMLNEKTKDELKEKLQGTIADLQQLLERMEENEVQ